jgi:hypothetical protein
MILTQIQNELKVPKGNFNSFGKYKYRSCENILEALKPILLKHSAILTITDNVEVVGSKVVLKAVSSLKIGDEFYQSFGFAEVCEHKGMSMEQSYGTASSYARKYSLGGLFLIDETEADPDGLKPVSEIDKLLQSVNNCQTIASLETNWNENPNFHRDTKYKEAVNNRKNELSAK